MIRRLLLVTSALMLSWVGVVDLGVGTQASPVEFVYVYAHDGHHQTAILTFTITERRPPTTYDSDTAAHTYDGPPLLSAPSATATYARESLSQPGAASWVSPASVRDRGDAAETGGLADDMVVVRGGTSDLPGPGEVFSGAYGQTLEDAAAGVPYGQIRATTVGEIRSGGGTVEIKPELTRSGVLNPQHVDICLGSGSCPFGPLMPNPIPKALRIQ